MLAIMALQGCYCNCCGWVLVGCRVWGWGLRKSSMRLWLGVDGLGFVYWVGLVWSQLGFVFRGLESRV